MDGKVKRNAFWWTYSLHKRRKSDDMRSPRYHSNNQSSIRNARTEPPSPNVLSQPEFPVHHAESTPQLSMVSLRKASKGDTTESIGSLESESPSSMSRSRNEKFHKIFKKIPEEETVCHYFSCAYVGDILLQGNLYVSQRYLCFYSKLVGYEKKIELEFDNIVEVTRERTAFIIPNAIGIITKTDKYVFGSFLSRENVFKKITRTWKKSTDGTLSNGDDIYSTEQSETPCPTPSPSLDNNNSIPNPEASPQKSQQSNSPTDLTSNSDESSLSDEYERTEHSPCNCVRQRKGGVSSENKASTWPRSFRDSQNSLRKSREDNTGSKTENSSFGLLNFVRRLFALRKTNLLLFICIIMVIFLLVSMIVLYYKISQIEGALDQPFIGLGTRLKSR
ncbi:unnamed protein product [Owenia fusiformis]|uniref:GRAM domain-containing protein n=1 Tax=Owenia fusiformis TaxID=6347 RepID=A0A8S4Q219_OWEFU|nr:unnamed protein product [Owenia fusiformis]